MAVIYTQLQRKSDLKWVTVSYSDEDPQPFYTEYGAAYDTETEALEAWKTSDERQRQFPQSDRSAIKADADRLAGVLERIAAGEPVEAVEMCDAIRAHRDLQTS